MVCWCVYHFVPGMKLATCAGDVISTKVSTHCFWRHKTHRTWVCILEIIVWQLALLKVAFTESRCGGTLSRPRKAASTGRAVASARPMVLDQHSHTVGVPFPGTNIVLKRCGLKIHMLNGEACILAW